MSEAFMQAETISFEEARVLIRRFSPQEKMKLLKELEKEMFKTRLSNLQDQLKDIPLSYNDINKEVEHVRSRRYRS